MRALATTTVSILSGESISDLGDTIDGTTVVVSGVIASILRYEGRTGRLGDVVLVPSDTRVQTVDSFRCRLPFGTPVVIDNRVLDERSGVVYVIDNIAFEQSPIAENDLRLDLRRVSI